MAGKNRKKMEIEDLATIVKKGFVRQEKRTDEKIDNLARSVQKGFDEVGKKFDEVGKKLESLETGQEEIKLRLTNVAYRFELEELERRVFILEKKTGISRK